MYAVMFYISFLDYVSVYTLLRLQNLHLLQIEML